MTVTEKEYKGGAEELHVNGSMTNVATTFTVKSTPTSNWPTGSGLPFVITVDRGTASEECMLCSARSGASFTVTTRGYAGTAAVGHSDDATVEHTVDPIALQDMMSAAAQTVGKVTTAGDQIVASGAGAFQRVAKGTSGQFWKQGASIPAWTSLASTDISDLAEFVRDTIGTALVAGTGITVTVNDGADTITFAYNGTSTGISDFAEAVSDQVGTMVSGNTETGITVTYQDADNTLDFAVGVDDSTIEINAGNLRLKDGGILAVKIADGTLTTAKSASEAYTAYTPTLTQSATVSKTTTNARYQQNGRRVTGEVLLAITSSGTGGQRVLVGLPVNYSTSIKQFTPLGTFWYFDSGSTNYIGVLLANADGPTKVCQLIAANQTAPFGTAPAVTATSGDKIGFNFSYEADS